MACRRLSSADYKSKSRAIRKSLRGWQTGLSETASLSLSQPTAPLGRQAVCDHQRRFSVQRPHLGFYIQKRFTAGGRARPLVCPSRPVSAMGGNRCRRGLYRGGRCSVRKTNALAVALCEPGAAQQVDVGDRPRRGATDTRLTAWRHAREYRRGEGDTGGEPDTGHTSVLFSAQAPAHDC